MLFQAILISDITDKLEYINKDFVYEGLMSSHGLSFYHTFKSIMPFISELYSFYGLTDNNGKEHTDLRQQNFLLPVLFSSKVGPKLVIIKVLS